MSQNWEDISPPPLRDDCHLRATASVHPPPPLPSNRFATASMAPETACPTASNRSRPPSPPPTIPPQNSQYTSLGGHGRNEALDTYPPPPLQSPGVARDGLPGGGGRRSPSDGVPGGGGGGGDCKGISRQTVVPSTDASKENTCEATFALMRCQCVSSNTNVIEDPKER